ncbi:RNA polymerase sigma factor [Rhodococcus sp. HNM0569]|uniref:RNA polymerase sigma factor n=1 Tax=Rhodococcus sp. HNM0569 TaxID=2716340 RepID=UPI00146B8447|nr:RNA polymerase sigma factor [Rhodococcus sp. HNM0569]NLU82512.1 RNA polymerase sigma factor [Rhodococcus sp. HNM0569]
MTAEPMSATEPASDGAAPSEWSREQIAEWYPGMLRFARTMVSAEIAEDVVQETWIAVLSGMERFEGRSSLRTWVYAVLRNKARKALGTEVRRRDREAERLDDEIDPLAGRLHPPGHPDAGHWSLPPSARFVPEERAVAAELREKVRQALEMLPPRQRQVVQLRDVEGFSPEEVCELLGLDAGNQRILLHRGRGKLRAHIECYQFGRGCPDNESGTWL